MFSHRIFTVTGSAKGGDAATIPEQPETNIVLVRERRSNVKAKFRRG